MNTEYNCQSCGMPLSRDIKGGGSHADGSLSTDYCSYCYQQGAFTQPDISSQEMMEQVKKIMWQKMYIPAFIGHFMVKHIPQLKRWQKEQQ
jgi:hypothetical protein